MDINNLSDFRVVELKKELEIRGLSKSGSKKELVDRLKNHMLLEEQKTQPNVSAQAPALEISADGENELVRNYLQQREQLMSQQMEQKKRYEEETYSSEMASEEEDHTTGKHSAAESSVVQAQQDDESDESTDVEDSETSKANVVHAGDGDKADDTEKCVPSDAVQVHEPIKEGSDAVTHKAADDADKAPVTQLEDRSRSPSASSSRSRSPVRLHDTEHRDHRRRSGSRSRSRSASAESSSSGSNERHSKASSHSRSPPANTERMSGDRVIESAADKLESQLPTKMRRSSSDEEDNVREPMETVREVKEAVMQAVEFTMDESQHSNDNRMEVSGDVGDTPEKIVDKQAPVGNVPQNKSSTEPDDKFTAAKPVRKRRWGSTSAQEKPVSSMNISTDSLRGLIPDINAGEIAAEDPVLAENVDDEHEEGEVESSPSNHKDLDLLGEDTRTTKIRRIVYDKEASDSAAKELSVETSPDVIEVNGQNSEEPSVKVAKLTRTVSREAASKPVRTLSIPADEPVDVGRRSSSPARRPPSNVVHVTGLVRPFTLGQLKELLGRTGTLVEDGFWIDSIKSHCYVVYETVEQAVATRKALHGKRWPVSNPKLLGVEFRSMDEFEFRKRGGAAAAATAPKPATDSQPAGGRGTGDQPVGGQEQGLSRRPTSPHDAAKSRSSDAREKSGAQLVREWDRNKLKQSPSREREDRDRRGKDEKPTRLRDKKEADRQEREKSRHDRRGREKNDKSGAAAKVEEEPPAKLLDDLFRKTKALPCIYWLPLTDEQVAEKMSEVQRQAALREQQRRERREAERQQQQKAQEERRAREAKPPRRRMFSENDEPARKSRADRH